MLIQYKIYKKNHLGIYFTLYFNVTLLVEVKDMLQIKEFAKLCGCTTSILRYYDHKDILKPYFIESFTGYRYYQNNQALEFYRIKQLKKVGFSLEEIKRSKIKMKSLIF